MDLGWEYDPAFPVQDSKFKNQNALSDSDFVRCILILVL